MDGAYFKLVMRSLRQMNNYTDALHEPREKKRLKT